MKAKTISLLLVGSFFSGCAGTMLPGRMYALPAGRTLQFSIQTSYGNGIMEAFDPQTSEKYKGEYSGFYKGQDAVYGNIGGANVSLVKPPTGANAQGILVGDKGTTIHVYFEIKPGLRPTGYGRGVDQEGNQYEIYF
ncbi:MAG: DUF4094 domain-containing protein [Candidatus Hodarchaeota archaeon]